MYRSSGKEDFFQSSKEGSLFSRLGNAFGMVLLVNAAGMVEAWIASSRKYGDLLASRGNTFPLEDLPFEDPLLGKRLLELLRNKKETSFFCSLEVAEERLYLQGWICCLSDSSGILAFRDRTRENITERKLRSLARRVRNILAAVQSASMGFWEWDLERNIFSTSRKWRDLLGLPSAPGKWFLPLSQEEREQVLYQLRPFLSGLSEEAPGFEGEYQMSHPWKEFFWMSVWGTVVRRSPSGKPLKIMGCHQDISLWKQALKDLEAEKIKFEHLFMENSTAISVLDEEGRVLQVNPAFESLFGFAEKELRGRALLDSLVPPELHHDFVNYYEEVMRGQYMSRETWRRCKNGSLVEVWLRSIPFSVHSRKMSYNMYLDITLRKRALRKLERMASTDMLTGIFNRQHFYLLAEKILREAREEQKTLSLVIFDLDNFKSVNDTYGHAVGDQVLQKVVRRIELFLEDEMLFARWGGEEFVLLLPYPGERAKIVAESFRNAVASGEYAPVPGVTASFGVAGFRKGHKDLGALEMEADEALYRAKTLGKNRVVLYDDMESFSSEEN